MYIRNSTESKIWRQVSVIRVATGIVAIDIAIIVAVALMNKGAFISTLVWLNYLSVILALVVYVIIIRLLLNRGTISPNVPLKAGLVVGALFTVDLLVENLPSVPQVAMTTATGIFMIAVLTVVASASFLTTTQTKSARRGVQSAILAMLVGIVILIGLGFSSNIIFHARLEQMLRPEYLTKVPKSNYAFVATVENATTHLIEAPILAAVMGVIGAFLSRPKPLQDP